MFLRTVWSLEEDISLIEGFLNHERKWIKIGENLRGRNPDAIKNRFHHICKNFNINSESDTLSQDLEKLLEFCEKYALPLFKSSPEAQSEASGSTQNDESESLEEVSKHVISQGSFILFGKLIQNQIPRKLLRESRYSAIDEFPPDAISRSM